MAPDLSFKADTLQGKADDAVYLQQYSQAVGVDLVESLGVTASAAGHPGLAAALTHAASQGNKAFSGMVAAYGHSGRGLVSAAQTLDGADQNIAGAIGGLGGQDPFLNGIG